MRLRLPAAALALALAVGVLAGCSNSDGKIHASATFSDVADLTDGAPVMMADQTIGSVSHIDLDDSGRRATVEFVVDRSAEVPADVVARVRRTSALGEKFIDLAPRTKAADRADAPLLHDHAVIHQTQVVSDLEQLVASGTDTFEALSASQIALLLDEGSKAFGGKGAQLRQILDDLSTVAKGYRSHTSDITHIIDNLDRLSGDLAPATKANGDALANLNDTFGVLNRNDAKFYALVRSLNRLAADGNRILGRHLDDITTQLKSLRDLAGAIAAKRVSVGDVLRDLPKHNHDLPSAEKANFVQVLLDVVVCGIPGGGDVPGDPVDACYPGGHK
jgi:phospholipid/cholesterol/gamma-HCH transport system substrate-binding protein